LRQTIQAPDQRKRRVGAFVVPSYETLISRCGQWR
jgi:hypothetical protein